MTSHFLAIAVDSDVARTLTEYHREDIENALRDCDIPIISVFSNLVPGFSSVLPRDDPTNPYNSESFEEIEPMRGRTGFYDSYLFIFNNFFGDAPESEYIDKANCFYMKLMGRLGADFQSTRASSFSLIKYHLHNREKFYRTRISDISKSSGMPSNKRGSDSKPPDYSETSGEYKEAEYSQGASREQHTQEPVKGKTSLGFAVQLSQGAEESIANHIDYFKTIMRECGIGEMIIVSPADADADNKLFRPNEYIRDAGMMTRLFGPPLTAERLKPYYLFLIGDFDGTTPPKSLTDKLACFIEKNRSVLLAGKFKPSWASKEFAILNPIHYRVLTDNISRRTLHNITVAPTSDYKPAQPSASGEQPSASASGERQSDPSINCDEYIKRMDEVKRQFDALANENNTLRGKLHECNQSTNGLAEALAKNTIRLNKLNSDPEEIKERIAKLKEKLNTTGEDARKSSKAEYDRKSAKAEDARKSAKAAEDDRKAKAEDARKSAKATEDARKAKAAEDARKSAEAAEDARKAKAAEDARKAKAAEDARKSAKAAEDDRKAKAPSPPSPPPPGSANASPPPPGAANAAAALDLTGVPDTCLEKFKQMYGEYTKVRRLLNSRFSGDADYDKTNPILKSSLGNLNAIRNLSKNGIDKCPPFPEWYEINQQWFVNEFQEMLEALQQYNNRNRARQGDLFVPKDISKTPPVPTFVFPGGKNRRTKRTIKKMKKQRSRRTK